MKSLVDQMSAQGGGDGPEALSDGLVAAYRMRWRDAASKVVILITDAPPHGLEPAPPSGPPTDGYPQCCPCGADPLEVAHKMARRGIVVYTIGAEPTLSTEYVLARDLLRAVAAITSGQFMPLASAALLAKVIVGSALEVLELTSLMAQIRLEATNARVTPEGTPVASKDDIARAVAYKLQQQAVTTTHIQVDDIYAGMLAPLDQRWLRCPSVAVARGAFAATAQRLRPQTEPPPPPNCTPCNSLSDMDAAMSDPEMAVWAAVSGGGSNQGSFANGSSSGGSLSSFGQSQSQSQSQGQGQGQQQQQQQQQRGQTASLSKGAISVEQVRRAIERGINTGLFK